MLVLADTGILLRLLDRTDPMHADARGAVLFAGDGFRYY